MPTKTAVVESELSLTSLRRVISRESGAIHVPSFFSSPAAASVAEQVVRHEGLGSYKKKYTSSVGRLFTPHIDAEWDEDAASKYHLEAMENITAIRRMFLPYAAPIDLVRLLLQELWPSGANVQRLYGRTCFVGTVRVFRPEVSQFHPHHDRIDEESDAAELEGLREQLVANVYLATPDEGGELELWLRDPDEEERARIRDVEGLLRSSVEPPALVIRPRAGDLTVFSTRMLHAVRPGRGGHRVGMAAFIGCFGEDRPLGYWS